MGCIKSRELIKIEPSHMTHIEVHPLIPHYMSTNKKLITNNDWISSPKNEPIIQNHHETTIKIINKDNETLKRKNYWVSAQRRHIDVRIEDNYKTIAKLGKGSFGSVFKVENIDTKEIRAMKVIKIENLKYQDDEHKFLREIDILYKLEHPNIIKIFEYYKDEINYYLITEFLSNGELYDYIVKYKKFSEKQAYYIMQQILGSVNYLHNNDIVHRDIKPENILIEKVNEYNDELFLNIKLIDFGTCNYITKNNNDKEFTVKVGSPFYIAPEVWSMKYNNKCDIWSCGVIWYIWLVGTLPFKGNTQKQWYENICYATIPFDMVDISSEARDWIQKMWNRDVEARYTAQDCLNHPFMKMYNHDQTLYVKPTIVNNILENIQNYNAKEKLQQATMAYIVHYISFKDEVENIKKVFNKFDKNKDGMLTFDEICSAFEEYFGNSMKDKLWTIFKDLDQDQSGIITYENFLRISMNQKELLNDSNLRHAFDKFDVNGDGKLSKDELKNIWGVTDFTYVDELIKLVDSNKDGYISYEEFKAWMDCILMKKEVKIRCNGEESHHSVEEDRHSSEDSFAMISPEKRKNKFDKEKFWSMIKEPIYELNENNIESRINNTKQTVNKA